MTANVIARGDFVLPFASKPVDAWNSAAAGLPGLKHLLQASADTWRVSSTGLAGVYDRKARTWWESVDDIDPGQLGPNLASLQVGDRYFLRWPNTTDTNAVRSPAGVILPEQGTIILVVELSDYDSATTIFQSETTTGKYVKIWINSSGEVEFVGESGATRAKTADLTPYDGPMLIICSWSHLACKISVNGTIGATTTGIYLPNEDRVDIGTDLDDDSKVFAAAILETDFHLSAYDAQRTAFVTATGQAFGVPFSLEWDFADLGDKLWLDIDPSTVADGDVTSITDSASGLVLAEATFPPNKAAADFNGYPSITFDSTNSERLRLLSLPSEIPINGDTSEIHILCDQQMDAADLTTTVLVGYGSGGQHLGRRIERYGFDGSENSGRITTNNPGSYIGLNIEFDDIHVVGGRWQDGVEYGYVDGSLAGQLTEAFATAGAGRLCLGCSSSSTTASAFFKGRLARVIGTYAITDDERDLIQGKLAFMGGVQNLLPDGHPYKRVTFV